jgi:hypothetical protein
MLDNVRLYNGIHSSQKLHLNIVKICRFIGAELLFFVDILGLTGMAVFLSADLQGETYSLAPLIHLAGETQTIEENSCNGQTFK